MADVPGAQRPVPGGGPEPRDPLDCWACAVLVTAQNLLVAAFNLLLLALVLGTILLPAVTMLGFGFLCHSQVSMRPRCRGRVAAGSAGHSLAGPGCLAWASRRFSSHSSFAPRHPLAPRTCGTRASQPCWSLDSCSSCRCSCLPWPATAASACASAWPIASCLTAEPSTGAGATRSRGQPGPRQGPRLLQPQERSGSEDPRVKNYPDDCPPSRSAQGLEALTRA